MIEQSKRQRAERAHEATNNLRLDRDALDILARDGLISTRMHQDGLALLHPAHSWGQWTLVLLAICGTTLILSGIVFFFAYNWVVLSTFQKFSLLQGAVVITASGATLASNRSLLSQLLLFVSSVLVGVFLAVFGQIYQTGADPWQLFALWALLILPWTLLSAFALQWLLLLALLNVALALWWDRLPFIWLAEEEGLLVSLALLNGVVLLVREGLVGKVQFGWLDGVWTRWLLAGAVLALLFTPLMALATGEANTSLETTVGIFALLAYGVIFVTYRFVWLELPILAMWALCLCILVLFSFTSLASDWGWGDIAITLVAAFLTLSLFTFAARYLKTLVTKSGEIE